MEQVVEPQISFFAGTDPYQVRIHLWYREQYVEFECVGGTHPHVGAITYADGVRQLLYQFPGHKEGELIEELTNEAQAVSHAIVIGRCGIHIDDATWDEIQLLVQHAKACGEEMIHYLNQLADAKKV